MDYRSTETQYVHFGGSVIAGAGFGSGVELVPNSSANNPTIQPAGDETNKGITIKAKGTGLVTIGDSSQTVQFGNSTTGISKFQRYTVQFTEPDAPASTYVDSTLTVTGATTNASYIFTPRSPLAAGYATATARCSSANEIIVRWVNAGTSTASGATNRAIIFQIG